MAIERRAMLKAALALPALSAIPGGSVRKRFVMNLFSVAGLQYHGGENSLAGLAAGMRLSLRPEPENPHDGFAVEILAGQDKLGYVPRSDNRHISRLLAQGAALECVVNRVDPARYPDRAIRVEVAILA
jgi:hypothetical protein